MGFTVIYIAPFYLRDKSEASANRVARPAARAVREPHAPTYPSETADRPRCARLAVRERFAFPATRAVTRTAPWFLDHASRLNPITKSKVFSDFSSSRMSMIFPLFRSWALNDSKSM